MRLGTTELILILVVALVIFGPRKLPELGKMVGKAVRSARTYISGNDKEWEEEQAAEAATAAQQTVVVVAAEPVETAPDAAPTFATAAADQPLAAGSEESVATPVADAAVAAESVTEAETVLTAEAEPIQAETVTEEAEEVNA